MPSDQPVRATPNSTQTSGGADSAVAEFPDVPEFNEAFREAIIDINGFVYAGDRLEAAIDLMKWMRRNPEKATFLLTVDGSHGGDQG